MADAGEGPVLYSDPSEDAPEPPGGIRERQLTLFDLDYDFDMQTAHPAITSLRRLYWFSGQWNEGD